LAVQPLTEAGETVYGVVFIDQGPMPPPDDRKEHGPSEATLQQLEQELEETREHLHLTIQELETTNEEFRSSNEELISVNEEMQSTNEELETSKEELQSTNEELQTVNAELSSKVEELYQANTNLQYFIQSTQIATVFLGRDLAIRSFTPAATSIFSLIPSDCGRPLADITSRIDYPELASDMRATLASGAVAERAVDFADGKTYFLARVLPYRNPENVIDGVILTFIDVTSLVAAEEKQKTLANELNHRVKNTLAVISSIAERTLPASEAKETLIGRLRALAQTHDLLVRTSWTDVPLRDLIAAELAPYAREERDNVRIDGAPVLLKPRAAQTLALVLHELATNAAKYGALSAEGGRVEIAWTIAGSGPGRLRLSWIERGGPEVIQLSKRGFGTELVERSIPFELQGEARLEIVDKAVRCTIAIPATPDHFQFGPTAKAAD
ncbi:MAG: sensor histidine kinase, partial [Stellaceae bacterium]